MFTTTLKKSLNYNFKNRIFLNGNRSQREGVLRGSAKLVFCAGYSAWEVYFKSIGKGDT